MRLRAGFQLLSELSNLRATALPTGGERIEASTGHDDLAHAMCLAASEALKAPAKWADGDLTWWEIEERDAGVVAFERWCSGFYGGGG